MDHWPNLFCRFHSAKKGKKQLLTAWAKQVYFIEDKICKMCGEGEKPCGKYRFLIQHCGTENSRRDAA